MATEYDDYEDPNATDYKDNVPYWGEDEAGDDEWVDETEVLSDEPHDGFLTDYEADSDVLASAGWGTDEDYGGSHDDFFDSGD